MNKKYVKAITLLELIVCVSIVGIIASIALPHFHSMMARQESQRIKQYLQQSFQYSKTQARLYRSRVVMCASLNGTECQNNRWSDGFIIFNDQNQNNQVNDTEEVLVHQRLDLKYGALRWNGALSRPNVFFNAEQGLPNGSNGSFYYCSHYLSQHERIILNNMGHSRTERITNC